MYNNPQSGQVATAKAQSTLHFGTLRRNIMAAMSADVFTPAERVRANHSVYECEDAAKLALWLKNVRRVFAEREVLAEAQALTNLAQGIERFEARLAVAPVRYATAAQTSEVHKLALHRTITDGERTQALLKLPRLTEPQAQALIGKLWAKVLLRTGGGGNSHNSTQNVLSYSSAA